MLAAPFANFNIFSNVMAQEYDNYYEDSSYSKYPTEDKKYECRTGPFEGFFVGSVEFCKHIKFDEKRDNTNRTGTQGPPGPPVLAPLSVLLSPVEILLLSCILTNIKSKISF